MFTIQMNLHTSTLISSQAYRLPKLQPNPQWPPSPPLPPLTSASHPPASQPTPSPPKQAPPLLPPRGRLPTPYLSWSLHHLHPRRPLDCREPLRAPPLALPGLSNPRLPPHLPQLPSQSPSRHRRTARRLHRRRRMVPNQTAAHPRR